MSSSPVPLDFLSENIRARALLVKIPEVTEEIKRRILYRQLILDGLLDSKLEWEKCKSDPIHFFNHWVWTFDPRVQTYGLPANLPFILRPKQVELIHWLQEREYTQTQGLIEKARDEGLSYVVLGWFLHHWLFIPGFTAGVGSRKEELVDTKGDPKSLFWKLRDMLYKLPEFLMPPGFTSRNCDLFMRLVNPANQATITGEAGANIGRGGRTSVYLVDEWAYVPMQQSVDGALSQNTPVIIKASTPNGVGDQFFLDRHSGKYNVFSMPWRENPDKNWVVEFEGRTIFPWYEMQRHKLTDVLLAQEVDIDYSASTEGILIPAKWVQAAFELELVEGSKRAGGLDVNDGGGDDATYSGRAGGVVLRLARLGDPIQQGSEVKSFARQDDISVLYYDAVGVGASVTATTAREFPMPIPLDRFGRPLNTWGCIPVKNNNKPSAVRYPDQPERPAFERFRDFAAENWWALRIRFHKTWERVTGVAFHPDEECISLKRLAGSSLAQELRVQLSQPIFEYSHGEKLVVNKYGHGTKSPDLAEGLLYSFAVVPEKRTGGSRQY